MAKAPAKAPSSKTQLSPLPPVRGLSLGKRIAFAFIPVLVLLIAGEIVVRVAGWDRPAFQTVPLPEELAGIMRPDRELLWSLKPDTRVTWRNTQVTINHQGTRGPDIPAKRPGELRVLSLGESTTFGVNVSDDQTYSADLEALLRADNPNRPTTVINAGVSAYSSFQSLLFLEERGLAMQPDVVLFYHEVNDYLPSSLRDASNNEVGAVMTDRQLYESRSQRLHRALMDWSALYRWASYAAAQARIKKFDRPDADNPLVTIGLPGYQLPKLLTAREGQPVAAPANEKALGRRVTEEERQANLERLLAMTSERGIKLVLLHPSYRDSAPHECLLTRFAAEHHVLMFETFPSLHPEGVPPRSIFTDAWHPNAEAHAWLARDLEKFLVEHGVTSTVK
jgi:lysophospholipase L1-like esterase